MAAALRPLSLGELLDRTFQLYRQHFLVFVGIVALPGLVSLALNLLLNPVRASAGAIATLLLLCVIALAQFVIFAISQAATITAVSELYLGRSIGIGQAFAAARGRIVEICVISLLIGLFTGLGLLLLIVPGILLALRWSVAVPVVVIEGLPPRAAMERSSDLTAGHRGRAFMIYLVYFALVLIISAIAQMPLAILLVANRAATSAAPGWLMVATQISGFLTQSLVGPLVTIAMSLFYYDERVRKEAFDLDHLMAHLDSTPDSSPLPA
ncbi:MAG: hypothetical protein ABI051_13265 [Vicinamibacterales bacterium]